MQNISIGIAAYNAERNIEQILKSLILQKENNFLIKEIIVHSDCSTDKTVQILKKITDERIKIIDNKIRKGFAGSAVSLINYSSGDLIVLLNDDIKIDDENFLTKIIKPFSSKGVALVGGNVQPLSPKTFIEKAGVSAFRVYEQMRINLSDINNSYTYDGAAMAMTSDFAKSIDFPKDTSKMGNFDSFLYAYTVSKGLTYKYAIDAVVYMRMPATLKDFLRRGVRNSSQCYILGDQFENMSVLKTEKPFWLYDKYALIEFIKNPFGVLFVFFIGFYVRLVARFGRKTSSPFWEVVESSKCLEVR